MRVPNRLPSARAILIACCAALLPATMTRADLSMETETARLTEPGHYNLSFAFEYQKSSQGEEYDVPLALEVGLLPRLELLIEPVAFTAIRPPKGPTAKDIGDTEVTLQYLLLEEQKYRPAIAGAVEVAIPTAHNLQIGKRVADYRIYLIASKRWRNFDFSANVGYNIVGAPSGVKTKNPVDAEFAIEWFVHPKFDLFAEVNYVDSSRGSGAAAGDAGGGGGGGGGGESTAAAVRSARARPAAARTGGATLTAEVAGTEIVGTAGVRYHLKDNIDVYVSYSYDNNSAGLVRTGLTWKF